MFPIFDLNLDFGIDFDLSKYVPGLPPIVYSLIYAVGTIIIFIILAKVIYFVIKKYILKITAKTKTEIDDKILLLLHKPIYYIMILIGLRMGLHWLDIPPEYSAWIDSGIFAVIVLIAFYILAKIIKIVVLEFLKNLAERTDSALDDQIIVMIDKFLVILVLSIGVVVILGQFGIEITPLLAGIGIMGLVVAFAAQESLSSIFGGIMLMVDQAFKSGDRVKIGKDMGDIISIGLRSTKIRTRNGNVLIIPNSELSKRDIINYSALNPNLRVELKFAIDYNSNIDKAQRIIKDVIKETPGIVEGKKIQVIVWELGESAIVLRSLFWVEKWKRVRRNVMGRINEKVLKEFKNAGINIPYPTTHVLLERIEKMEKEIPKRKTVKKVSRKTRKKSVKS